MPVIRRIVEVEVIDHEATGEIVRAARKKAGLVLKEVGYKLKLSPSYLGNLEVGNRPWTDHLFDKVMSAIEELKG